MHRSPAIAVCAVAAMLATQSFSREARAIGPLEIEAAAIWGGGFPASDRADSPIGQGLGARAGVLFPTVGAYGGLSFVDYYGGYGDSRGLQVHGLTYGIEGGYGLRLFGLLTVRGVIGFGNYAEIVERSSSAGTSSETHNSPYLLPSALAMLALGPVLVGADAGLLIASFGRQYSTATSATLHAQLGFAIR